MYYTEVRRTTTRYGRPYRCYGAPRVRLLQLLEVTMSWQRAGLSCTGASLCAAAARCESPAGHQFAVSRCLAMLQGVLCDVLIPHPFVVRALAARTMCY